MNCNEVAKALYERAWSRCGITRFHKVELEILKPGEVLFRDNRYIAVACWPVIVDGKIKSMDIHKPVRTDFDLWDINKWVELVKEMQNCDHRTKRN